MNIIVIRRATAVFIAAASCAAPVAQALPRWLRAPKVALDLANWCAEKLENHVPLVIEPLGGRTLRLRDRGRGDHPVTLELGPFVRSGMFNSAVVVKRISDPAPLGGYTGTAIVKVPHGAPVVGLAYPIPLMTSQNQVEWEAYGRLKNEWHRVESHRRFPRDAAFGPGTLPVAPLLGFLSSDRGFLLFKPLLKGKTLAELGAEARGGPLKEPYLSALRDHYELAQAIYGSLRAGDGSPYSADIRPSNLLWVDDEATLASLGYRRPGFVSFELSETPGNQPFFVETTGDMTFPKYLGQFERYMKREAGL